MFSLSKLSILSVGLAIGTANAFITGIQPFRSDYIFKPSPPQVGRPLSKLPVVFTTGSTKVSLRDLSITFGITTPAELVSNSTFGTPLDYTVDLNALGFSDTGPGEFTIEVPVMENHLYEEEDTYVLVAAVTRAVGNMPDMTFRADQFTTVFNTVS